MAIVKFENIEQDRWYNITLFANTCKAYGKKHTDRFEAKFDGQWWVDINGKTYSVYSVIFINDELAF